ncbi:MAG: TldD/PmbA family protein [Acidobacteriota bacterium]|jgi:PmbA protein
MRHADLATELLKTTQAAGADAADLLVAEGTEFSVTVRRGEVETLKEAGSKGLGIRVFVGQRTASSYTSDFSRSALQRLVEETVGIARATGEDPAAGLPDETVPPEDLDLALHDPSPAALPTEERIERARAAEATALETAGITNSQGASWSSGEGSVLLANTKGFLGSYRTSSVSLSVVPQAERDGQMERDYWYTTGRGLSDLETPEQVGRTAAERTLRRLGARQTPTCQVPVVFDPETAAELMGAVFSALSGYAVFRNATFLKDRVGEQVASPLLTLVDEGRRHRGLGSRPFDGEGLPTRRNVPLERGVLRFYLCDSYSARKIGATPTGTARRGIGGGPSVGAGNLFFEPGEVSPEEIRGGVDRGLYVTDLIGFGVNVVTGDYSQGAVGHWIENGRLTHPVHEVTIASNLKDMLGGVDAVGNDLVFRGSSASPTLRIRRMTVSGS